MRNAPADGLRMGTPAKRRRSRNAIAFAVLTLLALQSAMSYGINTRQLHWADAEYGTTLRNLEARKKEFPDRPLVVVFGSSRSRNGFAADHLSQPMPGDEQPPLVYNACLVGAHPAHQMIVLRRLIASGIKPSAVTIEIFPVHIRESNVLVGQDPQTVILPLDRKREAIRLRPADLDLICAYDRDRKWSWARHWLDAQVAP